jgi:hypothetical protein
MNIFFPEGFHLHTCHCENQKSHIICFILNSVLKNYMDELFEDAVKILSDHKGQFFSIVEEIEWLMALCFVYIFYIVE